MNFNQKRSRSGGGGKEFVNIQDGEKVQGVFMGDPYEFRTHWNGQSSVACTGDLCPFCADGMKPSFRFRVNFIRNLNGKLTPQIFEKGWRVYEAMRQLNESFPLEETVVTISRTGKEKDNTVYTILPAPNATLTTEQKQKLSEIPLLSLKPEIVDDEEKAVEEGNDSFENVNDPNKDETDFSF